MTRLLGIGVLLAALVGLAAWVYRISTNHGPSESVGDPSAQVDSLRAVVVRLGDSLDRETAAHAHDLDSLRARLARHPETVWETARILVHDTIDTGRVDTLRLVSALVLDDSACHLERDSLRGGLRLATVRGDMHAEALALCQRSLAGTAAPSSGGTAWTASAVLQADGEALRPGLGVDWRPFERLQVGAEAYARTDGTHPGAGLRLGITW